MAYQKTAKREQEGKFLWGKGARIAESACLALSLSWAAWAIAAEALGLSVLSMGGASLALYIVATAALALSSLAFRFRFLRRAPDALAAASALLALALILSVPPAPETALGVALLYALPVALHLPLPRNLLWSLGGACALCLLRFSVFPPAYLGQSGDAAFLAPLFLAIPAAAALPAALAAPAFRERDSLRDSLLSLIKVNLSYQDYSASLEERSAMEERLRLSRDIHDTVGYALTSAIMSLEAAKIMAAKEPGRIPEFIGIPREGAESALADVREFLSDLRGRDARGVTGAQAIARTVESFRRATGMGIDVDYGGYEWNLDDRRSFIVAHFVQEGMLNAYSHGRARRVWISFFSSGGRLSVNVRDDGRGAPDLKEGIGLAGMRERLESAGGSLEYHSAVDGFSLTARLPEREP